MNSNIKEFENFSVEAVESVFFPQKDYQIL